MNKINIKNLNVLIIFVLSFGLVIYDSFVIIINLNAQWTFFGFIIFCIAVTLSQLSYDYLFTKKRKLTK